MWSWVLVWGPIWAMWENLEQLLLLLLMLLLLLKYLAVARNTPACQPPSPCYLSTGLSGLQNVSTSRCSPKAKPHPPLVFAVICICILEDEPYLRGGPVPEDTAIPQPLPGDEYLPGQVQRRTVTCKPGSSHLQSSLAGCYRH